MALTWTPTGKEGTLRSIVGPFTIDVRPKGDGRWTWQVSREGRDAEASGVARSEGAAKTVSEQYVRRTGAI